MMLRTINRLAPACRGLSRSRFMSTTYTESHEWITMNGDTGSVGSMHCARFFAFASLFPTVADNCGRTIVVETCGSAWLQDVPSSLSLCTALSL
jgi:hypothetical protein